MTAGRVMSAVPVLGARTWSTVQRLLYKAGMALITLSGDRGSRAWADQVERARRSEYMAAKALDALHDERRRGNHLFTACSLALNFLIDDRKDPAMAQLRVAIIAGRKKL